MKATEITLAILAGGAGSRMGKPKGELTLAGQPILRYLIDRFSWPGPTLLVTAPGREHPPGWEEFSKEVVDLVSDQGPLRGILTALTGSETEAIIVTTVDMPGITCEQFHWLTQMLANHPESAGIMIARRDGLVERIEPFPSIFRSSARTLVESRLAGGQLSVQQLSGDAAIRMERFPENWDAAVWANLNDPNDLRNWNSRSV
jgi:molybdopterin-guanine dinucleotide biosynthesis protein A